MDTAVKSTHRVEIVPIVMHPHPAADLLSVIPVFGYTYLGRTTDWIGVTKGAYIPPDSVVDVTRPEFSFLLDQSKDGKTHRVKAKKLRGIVSFGLMIPVPDDTPLGEDWAERLGVLHYEPPLTHEKNRSGPVLGGDVAKSPSLYVPTYDLEAFRRYHDLFEVGEPVVVTEKIDGSNARYVFDGINFHCGSRTRWTREFCDYSHVTAEFLMGQGVPEDKAARIIEGLHSKPSRRNIWWQALRDTPALEEFLEENPGTIVFGEIAGNTNCVKYSKDNHFVAFDIMIDGRWLDFDESRSLAPNIPWVPLIAGPVPYDFNNVCEFAEGRSLWALATNEVIREGCVVKPVQERISCRGERVCLKVVSAAFLEKYR